MNDKIILKAECLNCGNKFDVNADFDCNCPKCNIVYYRFDGHFDNTIIKDCIVDNR